MTESTYEISTDPRGLIFIEPSAFVDMDAWHATAAELRREAPVLRVEASGWEPFWALTRHADVLEASRRSDALWNTPTSAPSPLFTYQITNMMGIEPKTLVHMHGHEHEAHRAITNKWFKPSALKSRQADIDALADMYVERMDELGGECDFARDIAVPYTLRIIMSIFGVPESDEALMLELTQGIFGGADPEYMPEGGDPMQNAVDLFTKFGGYFAGLAEDRKTCPMDDLATVIAQGTVDGEPISDNARLWYYIIVATAGHDTTSYSLAGGIEQLLGHPDQFAKLRADPDGLIVNATEEIIRWASPVRCFFRYPQEDITIGDFPIPAGDPVLLSYPSANRDDAVFSDPSRFDITRPDADRLISFGLGVHYCLGAQVARREIRTFVRKLAERVETIELAGEPEYVAAHFVGGVKHLPIRYTLKPRG